MEFLVTGDLGQTPLPVYGNPLVATPSAVLKSALIKKLLVINV